MRLSELTDEPITPSELTTLLRKNPENEMLRKLAVALREAEKARDSRVAEKVAAENESKLADAHLNSIAKVLHMRDHAALLAQVIELVSYAKREQENRKRLLAAVEPWKQHADGEGFAGTIEALLASVPLPSVLSR